MRSLLKRLPKPLRAIAASLQQKLFTVYHTKSYSQEGEDMILRRLFEEKLIGKTPGFYVDVGAHHPKRLSNTYFFYERGWSGVNIDAMPGSMALFKKMRPRDRNIEAAIAKDRRELTFFVFNEPALNTFDPHAADTLKDHETYRLVDQKQIVTKTLAEVLAPLIPHGQCVSFLSIDVEGMDLEVLQSNDWARCNPECILTESLGSNLDDFHESEITELLRDKGYRPIAKTVNTLIFVRSNFATTPAS